MIAISARLLRPVRFTGLLVFVSACGGGGTGNIAPTPAPTITISVSPSGTALSAATVVTFTASVSGGANVAWDFGDGTSGVVGTSVTHTFRSDDGAARNFTVVAAASAGGQTGSASISVPVRSLSGTWDQANLTAPAVDVFSLTQSGTTVTGSDTFNSNPVQFPTGITARCQKWIGVGPAQRQLGPVRQQSGCEQRSGPSLGHGERLDHATDRNVYTPGRVDRKRRAESPLTSSVGRRARAGTTR